NRSTSCLRFLMPPTSSARALTLRTSATEPHGDLRMSWKEQRRQQLAALDAKRRQSRQEESERKRQAEEDRHWNSMRLTSEELFKTAQAAVPAIGLEGQTTPKEISPYILARCQELEKWPPFWVPVESTADGLYGFCQP